jgi:hypothetical protein
MPMMNRYGFLLAVAFVATLAAGCATNGTSNSAANDDDKLVVTGSRIPVKGAPTGNVQATSDKNTINDIMRPSATGGMVGTGGR